MALNFDKYFLVAFVIGDGIIIAEPFVDVHIAAAVSIVMKVSFWRPNYKKKKNQIQNSNFNLLLSS